MTSYQKRTPDFKSMVALEAIKGELSVPQIALKYNIHPKQVTDWRDQLLTECKSVFIPKTSLRRTKTDLEKEELLMNIGQLTLEVEYLKKKRNSFF
jgi:transposase